MYTCWPSRSCKGSSEPPVASSLLDLRRHRSERRRAGDVGERLHHQDQRYWSNANMQLWNEALTDAKARWPNLKVFDWAAIAAIDSTPFADGIHHTSAGYAVRNEAIAGAFVGYFPPCRSGGASMGAAPRTTGRWPIASRRQGSWRESLSWSCS